MDQLPYYLGITNLNRSAGLYTASLGSVATVGLLTPLDVVKNMIQVLLRGRGALYHISAFPHRDHQTSITDAYNTPLWMLDGTLRISWVLKAYGRV